MHLKVPPGRPEGKGENGRERERERERDRADTSGFQEGAGQIPSKVGKTRKRAPFSLSLSLSFSLFSHARGRRTEIVSERQAWVEKENPFLRRLEKLPIEREVEGEQRGGRGGGWLFLVRGATSTLLRMQVFPLPPLNGRDASSLSYRSFPYFIA